MYLLQFLKYTKYIFVSYFWLGMDGYAYCWSIVKKKTQSTLYNLTNFYRFGLLQGQTPYWYASTAAAEVADRKKRYHYFTFALRNTEQRKQHANVTITIRYIFRDKTIADMAEQLGQRQEDALTIRLHAIYSKSNLFLVSFSVSGTIL